VNRFLWCIGLTLILGAILLGQRGSRGGSRSGFRTETLPRANSDAEQKILSVLEDAQNKGELYANVPVTDGRMLRLLVESSAAKNVVEIGTSTGLSGLWMCIGLQKTGGHLTTFEYDAGRAATARKHFQAAGVDSIVTLVEGDAHQTISRVKAPVDLAFIDADKEGYVDYLNKLVPLMRPGGLILAHNVGMADEYTKLVTANPALETLFYMDGGGLGITLKKR
jgi:caffeoyl-CoA O-methyltransferase